MVTDFSKHHGLPKILNHEEEKRNTSIDTSYKNFSILKKHLLPTTKCTEQSQWWYFHLHKIYTPIPWFTNTHEDEYQYWKPGHVEYMFTHPMPIIMWIYISQTQILFGHQQIPLKLKCEMWQTAENLSGSSYVNQHSYRV